MTLRRSRRFAKQYARLPEAIRRKVEKTLRLLATNPSHPGLKVRKLVNQEDIWEARIDYHTRMTFQKNDHYLLLRAVGTHAVYSRP